MRKKQATLWLCGFGAIIALGIAPAALAQTLGENNFLDKIDFAYQVAFIAIRDRIVEIARAVFITLIMIDLVWLGYKHITDPDFSSFLSDMLRTIIIVGFGFWIMENPQLISKVIEGFRDVGAQTTALAGEKISSASDFLDLGYKIAAILITQLSFYSVETWFVAAMGLWILWILVGVAVMLLIIQIQAYALAAGGLLLVMFWGSSYTRNYTQSYFTWVIAIGMKQFFILMMAGIGYLIIFALGQQMIASVSVSNALALLGIVGVFKGLMERVPNMVDGLMSSSTGGYSGGAAGSPSGATAALVGGVGTAAVATTRVAAGAMSVKEAASLAGTQGHTGARRVGATMSNLGRAAAGDMAGRMSGATPLSGSMAGRMAGAMKAERMGSGEELKAATPAPSGTVSAGTDASPGTAQTRGAASESVTTSPSQAATQAGSADRLGDTGPVSERERYLSGIPSEQVQTSTKANAPTSAGAKDKSSDDIARMKKTETKLARQKSKRTPLKKKPIKSVDRSTKAPPNPKREL